jgi:hypothetical protein
MTRSAAGVLGRISCTFRTLRFAISISTLKWFPMPKNTTLRFRFLLHFRWISMKDDREIAFSWEGLAEGLKFHEECWKFRGNSPQLSEIFRELKLKMAREHTHEKFPQTWSPRGGIEISPISIKASTIFARRGKQWATLWANPRNFQIFKSANSSLIGPHWNSNRQRRVSTSIVSKDVFQKNSRYVLFFYFLLHIFTEKCCKFFFNSFSRFVHDIFIELIC